ncbi:PRC-barrel domain containing protein [Alteriqipengyuania lutimaris]|uniref:PRC-barrel domain containing protein n=1 Tax=Alteriqipengyuania lutimaris TaxID=1538146 RepID=A0A395LHC2_9SPHN|nr:PRC-barrel domain containing protein [Alteriqipengyuania lutimaris]MBB3034958.1 hypothetical protein [Alteriqipengyuania lutimaris]RDS76222.1 PRC-barrel domain containing protein [Alteriqipengyuania lutimaris]
MTFRPALAVLLAGSTILAACGDTAAEQEAEQTEDAIEAQAAADVADAPAEEILGVTEKQLLDADLVDADGNELGEIKLVERNAMRTVTGLLVELEDSDRYVTVKLSDVTPRPDGDDFELESSLSAGQLASLPDAEFVPNGDTMTGAGAM